MCPQPPIKEGPQADCEVEEDEMDKPEKHVSSEFLNQKNHVPLYSKTDLFFYKPYTFFFPAKKGPEEVGLGAAV